MTPVTQDKFGLEGNCMAACIASIFDLPLSEVPNFAEGNGNGQWFAKLWNFCRARGFEVIPWYCDGVNPQTGESFEKPLDFENLPEHLQGCYPYYLQCGPAARGWSHATVGWMGGVIHDPHPSRASLIKTDSYYFLKPIPKAATE